MKSKSGKKTGSRGASKGASKVRSRSGAKTLCNEVRTCVEGYFEALNGEQPCGVYNMVLSEVEKPLLQVVMHYCEFNQTQAARVLGINRNTLRKKLELYDITEKSGA